VAGKVDMNPLTGLPESDELVRWIVEARRGSREALERAIGSHLTFLLSLAGHQRWPELRTPSGSAALVRATVERALEQFEEFNGRDGLGLRAWLCRLMLDEAEALLPALRETEPIDPGQEREAGPGLPSTVPIDPEPPSAEAPAVLERSVGELPWPDREVILL